MRHSFCLAIIVSFLYSVNSYAFTLYKGHQVTFSAGFWGQAWYQTVSNARDKNGDGKGDSGIYDTLIRRSYFYARANFLKKVTLFAHLAGDRIGQDYLHNRPSLGLGANLVMRDAWINLDFFKGRFMVQVGRMYIPFTRNYGTTSTKALLNLDLNWAQGGIRGGIFYPSRVGRDDGICVWGNIFNKRLQYRFMVAKGIYDDKVNPGDHPRFAGRVSWAFQDVETSWFNQGTYLGKKRMLTIGAGFDYEHGLYLQGKKRDYSGFTFDLHYERPLAELGAVSAEAAFIYVNNIPGSLKWTQFEKGGDASIYSFKAGYLLPFSFYFATFQPNIHFERIDPETGDGTNIFGGGLNIFLKGHANKISFDVTSLKQDSTIPGKAEDHLIFTLQFAIGF